MRSGRSVAILLFCAVTSFGAPGDLKWSYRTGGAIRSSPAAGTNGLIIVGSFDGQVYALASDSGGFRWRASADGPLISSPAVGESGLVYIGTTNGVLALDGLTGSRKWFFGTNPARPVYTTPSLGGDGNLYFATKDGKVLALDATSGVVRWSTNMFEGQEYFGLFACYSSPVLGHDGALFVGASHQNTWFPNASFRSIDPASGKVRWVVNTINAVQSTAAIAADGTIFFCGFDKLIRAVDPATGATKWERLTGDSISSSPAIGPNGTLYVGGNDGYLYAVDSRTGAIQWRFLTGDSIHSSPAVAADGTVYFGSHDKNLYALDGETGARKWFFATEGFVLSSPLIGPDGTVYVGSYDGKLYALEGTAPPAEGWSTFKGNARRTGSAADTFSPLLANPRFDASGFAFDLHSKPAKNFKIEYSDDLSSPGWTELTNVLGGAPSVPLLDPSAQAIPFRYYRGRTD